MKNQNYVIETSISDKVGTFENVVRTFRYKKCQSNPNHGRLKYAVKKNGVWRKIVFQFRDLSCLEQAIRGSQRNSLKLATGSKLAFLFGGISMEYIPPQEKNSIFRSNSTKIAPLKIFLQPIKALFPCLITAQKAQLL